MTRFSYETETIAVPGAEASMYVIPWDTDIFGVPVAELDTVRFDGEESGTALLGQIASWCAAQDIHLCSCRCPQQEMKTALLLQAHGFRIVEINYLPVFTRLQDASFSDHGLTVQPASDADISRLERIAGNVFSAGRFHNDPRIGTRWGDIRYATWMRNSAAHPTQHVEKIVRGDELIGGFVTELRDDGTMYWWLTVLAEEFMGKGMAKPVWQTMMMHAQKLAASSIMTSISSHNLPVHNLYVSLGYRFTEPAWSFHWLRQPFPAAPIYSR